MEDIKMSDDSIPSHAPTYFLSFYSNQVLVFSFFHVFIKRSLKDLNIFDSDNGIIDIPVVAFARVYFVSFQL